MNANSVGLRELPMLSFGEDHEFHVGCPATAWLSAGWSAPDGAGAWAAGERACIVIPLADGALGDGALGDGAPPDAAPLAVQINGGTRHHGDAGYEPSVRLFGTRQARALVLDFEFTRPRRFLLQQLSVRALPRARLSAPKPKAKAGIARAASALAIVAVLGFLVAAGTLLPASSGAPGVQAAELHPDPADASHWSQIKHTVVTRMEWVRDDLEHLLQQHRGQQSAPMSSHT